MTEVKWQPPGWVNAEDRAAIRECYEAWKALKKAVQDKWDSACTPAEIFGARMRVALVRATLAEALTHLEREATAREERAIKMATKPEGET